MSTGGAFSLRQLPTYSDEEVTHFYLTEIDRFNELVPVRKHYLAEWQKAIDNGDLAECERTKKLVASTEKMMDASRDIVSMCEAELELRKRRGTR